MYHIKSDKRARTSAAMLYESLMACMEVKSFEKISITELVDRATVGRSTFYRNFDEIADILYWKCDQQFSELLRGYSDTESMREKPLGVLNHVFGYWLNHSATLEVLFTINRMDIIYDCFARNSAVVSERLKRRLNVPDSQYEYFLSIRIGVFIGVMKTWLHNGKKETAQQLSDMLGQQLHSVVLNGMIL